MKQILLSVMTLCLAIVAYASSGAGTALQPLPDQLVGAGCIDTGAELHGSELTALQEDLVRYLKEDLPEITSVALRRTFRSHGWSILLVDTHISDDGYLFFKGDPRNSKYLAIWGGSAMIGEESVVKNWVAEKVPGLPDTLARCFVKAVVPRRELPKSPRGVRFDPPLAGHVKIEKTIAAGYHALSRLRIRSGPPGLPFNRRPH